MGPGSVFVKHARNIGANSGADREGRREYAAGDAADRRERSRRKLQRRVIERQHAAIVKCGPRLAVTRAVNGAVARETAKCDAYAAKNREKNGMIPYKTRRERRQRVGDGDKNAAEHGACRATDDATKRHCEPRDTKGKRGAGESEIGIVAQQGFRGQARKDHRADNKAARPHFEASAHLFDREHNSGERRIERCGDARGCAGQNETGLAPGREASNQKHHRGADLYGRSFAAGRCADQQSQEREENLADCDTRPHQARARGRLFQPSRRNGLRDARALCVGKNGCREPGSQSESERREEKRRIGPVAGHRAKSVLREIRKLCEGHRHKPHHKSARECTSSSLICRVVRKDRIRC